jgi:AraC family transcriptional regulator
MYASHLAFYEHAYGQHIAESHTIGALGATLLVAEQSAGDWSDAPTPDLIITRHASSPANMTLDIGAGQSRVFATPNAFVVVPPDYATTIIVDQAHRIELVAIPFARMSAFVGENYAGALPSDGDFGSLHRNVWRDKAAGGIIDALFAEARAGGPHRALGADALLLRLVATLITLRDRRRDPDPPDRLAPWQLKRALERIEADPAEDLLLAELAATVGLSPSHFCRAFARSTGAPPHRYRLARRIDRAKELLIGTQLPITDIALSCGFASSQHFASAFRRLVGTTPTAYRKER